MTTQPEAPQTPAPLNDEQVAAWLRAHPDFLVRHDDVLRAIDVPHRPGGEAASLIERQVAQLRRRNEALDQRLAELMRTAHANERVGARLLALGRGLLEAESLDGVLALVRETLLNEFAADEAVVLLIAPEIASAGAERSAADGGDRFLSPDEPAVQPFAEILERTESVCGQLSEEQYSALFGEQVGSLASGAIVPLRPGLSRGLIGLASREPAHFHADMGTLFLDQLGELVAAGLARHGVG